MTDNVTTNGIADPDELDEPIALMHEQLEDQIGEENLDGILQQTATQAAVSAVEEQIMTLYANRNNLEVQEAPEPEAAEEASD